MTTEATGEKALPGQELEATGEKALPDQAAKRSVIKEPAAGIGTPTGLETGLLWMVASAADEMGPWCSKERDQMLRTFIPTESLFASALGIVCARNAAFSWYLDGPDAVTARMQEALATANKGRGWQHLMLQISFDLYSQDKGAFIEIVREGDGPESPLLSLNHLDAARCHHTGRAETPVIYQDRDGQLHELKYWQVLQLSELPSPEERYDGWQYCALTRLLLAAQVMRNAAIYQREKTGGRHSKALILVKGVTTSQMQDAVNQVGAAADAAGLQRYVNPILLGSVDPAADVDAKVLELAGLPDGWDGEKENRWYIAQIAMAFLTDYQEFAPLPGAGLGTSTQSQVLHLKSRGKGPGLFMKLVSQALNYKVLPDVVRFAFEEQDLEAEQAEAEVKKTRAETRKMKFESTELDSQGLRQEALDAGDMSQEEFDRLGGQDVTPDVTLGDEERAEGAKALAPLTVGLGQKAASVGQFIATRIHRIFTQTADDLAALGYMDTENRVKLSKVIGTILRELEGQFNEQVAGVVARNVADEDARQLVGRMAEKALAGTEVTGYRPFGWIETGKAAEPARADPFEDERLRAERKFADLVEGAFKKTFARIKKRLREEAKRAPGGLPWEVSTKELRPNMFDDEEFWGLGKDELMAATSVEVDTLLRQAVSQAERLGVVVNFDLVNEQVLKFTGKYSDEWWKQLSRANRKALRAAIQANIEQGAPLKSLVKSLEPTFGRQRAERIAATETTRLYAEGNRMAYASDPSVEMTEWYTVEDERTCELCESLAGKRWPVGHEENVPPAHVSCRCFTVPVSGGEALTTEVE